MKPTVSLEGQKLAVLMADGFELAEYLVPVKALRAAGAEICVVSLRKGKIRGVNLHEPARRIRADQTIEEVDETDFDGLFIPGGFINPDLLRQSARVRQFVSDFDKAGKPIATLCHGPWVLGSSGLLTDRVLTSWPGIRDDVVNAGGSWADQPVVRDRNLLTSRGPQDFAEFVPAVVQFFGQQARTSELAPQNSSPQRDEPPAVVLAAMKALPRPSFRGFALGLAVVGLAAVALRP